MQITNEEMEVLNRATEIVSKYASTGNIPQSDLQVFVRILESIIKLSANELEIKYNTAPYTETKEVVVKMMAIFHSMSESGLVQQRINNQVMLHS